MRVAIVGRTYLLAVNRDKWRYVPQDVSLSFITPTRVQHALESYTVDLAQQWDHFVLPVFMARRMSGFGFSPLAFWRTLRRIRPHLIQVDEEPSSLALLEVLLLKRILGCHVVFFTWDNLAPRYPIPFRWCRRLALRLADGALAGNNEAATLLKRAGFRKPLAVIPQLGVDPDTFSPMRDEDLRNTLGLTAFTIGYIGRLVPEKGLMLILEALATLRGPWQWLIVGRGQLRTGIDERARQLGIAQNIRWVDTVPHQEVPRYLNAMDVLVLPSLTTARWKEQFGHILIEAMACGVPVIGSDSGAIPEVIGDAGLIIPEGDAQTLAEHLRHLRDDDGLRAKIGQRGRERVLSRYTNQRIAEQTVALWEQVRSEKRSFTF